MPQSPPPIIHELVDRFYRNVEAYCTQGYNETQLRREFLDPFFEALGWDVVNRSGHAEAYKDVIHEDSIKIGGVTKAPDYCFRIGGTRKFFLEAKKPSVNLKEDISPAYQLRRYAWSAKLPLSILTDFEEFAVYDSRAKPKPTDKAGTGRILYLTYQDYTTHWEEISSIFSKDAILKGSFDKYAVSERKRGTATVDKEFLTEIENWRDTLARHLALRNLELTVHDLNFSVQRTIDRLIFLRICEDRGVEIYGQLQALLNGEGVYSRLCALYSQADDRYNSGLFHFQKEKGRAGEPDTLTPNLIIDDKILKDIIKRLYYPESPYEFSVFPAEILGQVYEQFLGKVIRLTAGHQAKIEAKPEVKKAGGVYYTPNYIVDYIVKQTVGTFCDGKTPKQIANLRILDPACGSGSFLIGAYTYLLAYHRDWYATHGPAKHRKEIFQGLGGEWKLTTKEKKRILLNNIYGVDIDSQAVEVTKLSLLLKVLEGESGETLKSQLSFVGERALPDLGNNIKCGNSLIGPDYFTNMLLPDEDELRRINPFDWTMEFPEIIKNGGFDAVIGNPPYVDVKGLPKEDVEYIFANYSTANNRINLFSSFLEKSHSICKSAKFRLGMIVPAALLAQDSYKALRIKLLGGSHILSLVRLPNESFGEFSGDVKVDTVIVILGQPTKGDDSVQVLAYGGYERISSIDPSTAQVANLISQSTWAQNASFIWTINTGSVVDKIISKCEQRTVLLEDCVDFSLGLTPYDKYKGHTPEQIKNRDFHATFRKNDTFKELLAGNDVNRYFVKWNGEKWISYGPWLGAPREKRFFKDRRILVKQIIDWTSKRIWAAITEEEFYNTQNAFNLLAKDGWNLNYILAIINSKLMNFYHRKKFLDEFKMRFQKILIKDCRRFPIREINPNDKEGKLLYDNVVSQVDLIMNLQKQLAVANSPNEKIRLQRQIEVTDREIDRLVYDLYELTEEEIAIVEGKAVASSEEVCENDIHECANPIQPGSSLSQATSVASPAQYSGESGSGSSAGAQGTGDPVYGIREPTPDYESPGSSSEESSEDLGSTRYFSTSQGILSYSELAERLAVNLAGLLDNILQVLPAELDVSPDWVCEGHKELAGDLFPDWAGRYRDVNVQVGQHTPPPYYEVPTFMRMFCDDLRERLRHLSPEEANVQELAALLAWVDWRFQWIHPFKDFNGRIGRVLLAALLYKLALPHVETAPLALEIRQQYLSALRTADDGNLEPLTDVWLHRLAALL